MHCLSQSDFQEHRACLYFTSGGQFQERKHQTLFLNGIHLSSDTQDSEVTQAHYLPARKEWGCLLTKNQSDSKFSH